MKQTSRIFVALALLLSVLQNAVTGFTATPVPGSRPATDLHSSTENAPTLSASEEKVHELLTELHESKFPFRIVVVGNGAILESTNLLGPAMKMSQSPKSEANLVTFASEDQSFEFHLMIAQVAKVAMLEKESPVKEGKMMRILRFLNNEDKSICSLILAEDSPDVGSWYQELMSKYGPELTL